MGFRKRLIDERLTRRDDTSIQEDLERGLIGERPREARREFIDILPEQLFQPAKDFDDTEERRLGIEGISIPERARTNIPPRQQFRQEAGEQIRLAQESFERGAEERGAVSAGQFERQAEAGVRVGGIVVAQKEFNDAITAEKDAIEFLARTSGITDRVRLQRFKESELTKLQGARRAILLRANQTRLILTKRRADATKKRAAYQLIGTVAGAVIGFYIAGPAGGVAGASAGKQASGGTTAEEQSIQSEFDQGREPRGQDNTLSGTGRGKELA